MKVFPMSQQEFWHTDLSRYHMLYDQYFAENATIGIYKYTLVYWHTCFISSILLKMLWLVYTVLHIHKIYLYMIGIHWDIYVHDVSPGMICFSLISLRARSDFRYSPQLQHKEMLDVCNKLPVWITHRSWSTGYSTPGTTQVWEFNPHSLAQWVLLPKSKRFYSLYMSLLFVHWNPNPAEYTNTGLNVLMEWAWSSIKYRLD